MKDQQNKQNLLSVFKTEAGMHIQELNRGLLELENAPQDKGILEEICRRVHTLKGSARMMGFMQICKLAHEMEDLLGNVKTEGFGPDKKVFDRLFQNLDSINALLQTNDEEKAPALDGTDKGSKKNSAHPGVKGAPLNDPVKDSEETASSKLQYVNPGVQNAILVKTDKLDSLASLVGEMVLDQIKSENKVTELSKMANMIRERIGSWSYIKQRIRDDLTSYNPHAEEASYYNKPSMPVYSNIVDDVLNLLDEYTVISNRMTGLMDEYKDIATHRRLVIDRLQDDIRNIRLVPISTVFDTFPRAIRDLSKEYNKEIKLGVSGGDIELDKTIIDTIKDPLMHLVRNAVDHGIEEPEERIRRGKPRTGNISLSAHRRGGAAVIEISDDGAGINLEKVKQAALRLGHIRDTQIQTMDKESAIQLIFISGLSTSPIITDISGRGVGMNVVAESISRKLKGEISIQTELGKGTKISLVVPITLAIMRGLMVTACQETFAIPTISVEKCVKVPSEQIRFVEGKQAILDGERIIPLVQLSDILDLDNSKAEDEDGTASIVVISHAQKHIGFCVDSFLNEQEIVTKSLGTYLKAVPNVAGVTIITNGEVVPVLHVPDMMESARNKMSNVLPVQKPAADDKVAKKYSILIVDDSLTTRELERSMLEASGYDVHVAVDGLDGLSKLSERKYNLIISDVQMPRMDGFEMVDKLKKDKRYKDIPIIMVTGLQKDEERRRGIEVGASAYIVKSSFDQASLLETIQMLVG